MEHILQFWEPLFYLIASEKDYGLHRAVEPMMTTIMMMTKTTVFYPITSRFIQVYIAAA
jgi:hypothetical protein